MMDYDTLAEYASDRLNGLVDQLAFYYETGDQINVAILKSEIKDLSSHMDREDYDFFFQTYHRHLSESYGVVFEQEHGDPELMFGGTM